MPITAEVKIANSDREDISDIRSCHAMLPSTDAVQPMQRILR
jgi:hypothetical protein